MTQTTPPTSDDDLPDERELAALYARLPKVEPDASLDAAVLAEATRAAQVKRRPRWPVALASAAVLVLAVGVAWQVRDLQPAPSAIPAAAAPPPAAPAPAMPAAADRRAADRRAADSIAAEAPNVGAASAAKPAQRAHVHRIAPAYVAKVVPPPAPEPLAAPVPPAPAAPAEPPSPEQYETTAPAPAGMLRQNIAAKVAADAAAPSALGPDDRVGEIRRLLGSGDRAQALRELKELRRRYPHYDLPQDLRDLNP